MGIRERGDLMSSLGTEFPPYYDEDYTPIDKPTTTEE